MTIEAMEKRIEYLWATLEDWQALSIDDYLDPIGVYQFRTKRAGLWIYREIRRYEKAIERRLSEIGW